MKALSFSPKRSFERGKYPIYFLIPGILLYIVFAIYPTITNFYYAMTDWSMKKSAITFIGLQQFQRIFQNNQFLDALKNSAIYGVSITILKVALGLMLALALNTKLRSKNILRSVYFLPIIISTVAVGLLFRSMMDPFNGFLNQLLQKLGFANLPGWITDPKMALWCCVLDEVWRSTGLCMAIFLSGLQSISSDYYEAATIDGASALQKFYRVTWPLLRPALTINLMMSLVTGLRGFEPIYYLTGGGPGNASQTIMTLSYKYMGEGLYGYSAAMNLFTIVAIVILAIPLLRAMTKKEVEM